MHMFCNICSRTLGRRRRGSIHSCSHVVCVRCQLNASCLAGCTASAAAAAARKPAVPSKPAASRSVCAKCRRGCSAIAINRAMPADVQQLFANPGPVLRRIGKAFHFQQLQMLHFRRLHVQRRRRLRKLRRVRANRVKLEQRLATLRELRPRITLLRTEIRNKFT